MTRTDRRTRGVLRFDQAAARHDGSGARQRRSPLGRAGFFRGREGGGPRLEARGGSPSLQSGSSTGESGSSIAWWSSRCGRSNSPPVEMQSSRREASTSLRCASEALFGRLTVRVLDVTGAIGPSDTLSAPRRVVEPVSSFETASAVTGTHAVDTDGIESMLATRTTSR
jgi:hypothetical protein